jgi:diadenosine tetraphosphatase ApaH/serine/threonine PP2A family protein phosphatase
MRLAVLADIHGNWEALEAVLRHAAEQKVERYALLGDAVGYGADPNACMEWAVWHADFFLMGNHEKAVVDPALREWFTSDAREAIIWTAGILKKRYRDNICGLSCVETFKGLMFVHGSPEQPEQFHYLMTYHDAVHAFRFFENQVCFVGHTHVPCFFCYPARRAGHFLSGVLKLDPAERYILNPGSVGQPRDGDRRAAYGIYDDRNLTFEIFRLEYDNKKAAQKIRQAGLPDFLADRLL